MILLLHLHLLFSFIHWIVYLLPLYSSYLLSSSDHYCTPLYRFKDLGSIRILILVCFLYDFDIGKVQFVKTCKHRRSHSSNEHRKYSVASILYRFFFFLLQIYILPENFLITRIFTKKLTTKTKIKSYLLFRYSHESL